MTDSGTIALLEAQTLKARVIRLEAEVARLKGGPLEPENVWLATREQDT
jgi:hypothetical protein